MILKFLFNICVELKNEENICHLSYYAKNHQSPKTILSFFLVFFFNEIIGVQNRIRLTAFVKNNF